MASKPTKPRPDSGVAEVLDRALGTLEQRLPPHGRALATVVFWLFVFDLLVCLAWARTLTPFLLGAAVAWWLATGREGALARTARELAAPVAIGLTIVSAALAALNVFGAAVPPAHVHSVEDGLARVRLSISAWTHLSLWWILVLGTGLLLLAVLATELDAVGRVKQAKRALGFTQTLLLVLCSFVVYAQAPLQKQVDRAHARAANEWRAALEREWRADADTIAARSVRQAAQTLPPAGRHRLLALVSAIDPDPHARPDVVVEAYELELLGERSGAPLQPEPGLSRFRPPEEQRLVDPTPTSRAGLDAQQRAARAREAGATRSERRAGQATAAALTTVEAIVGLTLPIRRETLQTVVESLVGNLGESLAARSAAGRAASLAADPAATSAARRFLAPPASWTRRALGAAAAARARAASLRGPRSKDDRALVDEVDRLSRDRAR